MSTVDRAPETGQGAAWRRWAALAVLSGSLLAIGIDLTVLNVALPEMAADLRPSAAQQLWIVDVYSLVLAGLLVTMSALADRWGRKRMLLTGFGVFGLASLLVLAADTAEAVIAVRALLGVGGAMIMPTTLSMIRTVFTDPVERARALGVWAAVSSGGVAFGPIIGGLLLERFSWHAAFLLNVPLALTGLVAGIWLLPEARAARPGRLDPLATGLSIAGMVALVWAIKDLAKHFSADGLANPLAWTVLALAVAALTWFVVRCLRRPDPLLDVRLFGSRAFTASVMAALTAMLAMAAALLLVAQWLQLVEGHSPLMAGVLLLPLAAGAAVVSPLAPALAARIGARTVLAAGLGVSAVGFLLLPLAPQPLAYPWVAVVLAMQGAAMGSLAVASVVIMSNSPQEKAGSAAAIEETSYDLGSVLGVAILGSVAAVVYRSRLGVADADPAGESLGAALEIATRNGAVELAVRAQEAFTTSLSQVGLVSGLIMLGITVAVFALTPHDLDLAGGHSRPGAPEDTDVPY
ncbi:MFS transporter [Streptosporangium saharense]